MKPRGAGRSGRALRPATSLEHERPGQIEQLHIVFLGRDALVPMRGRAGPDFPGDALTGRLIRTAASGAVLMQLGRADNAGDG